MKTACLSCRVERSSGFQGTKGQASEQWHAGAGVSSRKSFRGGKARLGGTGDHNGKWCGALSKCTGTHPRNCPKARVTG